MLDDLVAAGLLRRAAAGWFWTDRRPRRPTSPTSAPRGGSQVQLVEAETGRVLGTVDAAAAHASAHAGAVYVHRARPISCDELDLDESVAVICRDDPGYSTFAREITDIAIVAERDAVAWGECRLAFGDVDVTNQVVSFLRRRLPTRRGAGRGAARPAPPHAAHLRRLVDRARRRPLEAAGLATADMPGRGARRRALLHRAAAAVRDL